MKKPLKVFKNFSASLGYPFHIEHHNCESFEHLNDKQITKAHAICYWNQKVLLVHHSRWRIWGNPGGSRENNEPITQTLAREVEEEAYCKILKHSPLCYQFNQRDNAYHLTFLCEVEPLGDFQKDPAGNINEIRWVRPGEVFEYIESKPFRQEIWKSALKRLEIISLST